MLIIPDCLTCTLFPFLPSLPVSPERKFLSPILLLQTSGSELSPLLPAYLHVLCASHSFSYCHVPTELLDTQAVLGLRACWFISYHLSWRNLLLLLFSCSVISNSFATLRTVAHSPSGSSVHGISRARILEWVVISSSRASSWPRDHPSPALAGEFFTTEPPRKPILN